MFSSFSDAREFIEAAVVDGVVAFVVSQLLAKRLYDVEWLKALVFSGLMALFFPVAFTAYTVVAYSAWLAGAVLLYSVLYSVLLFVPWLILGRLWIQLLPEER
ncbi:MAG: hypothetical protein M3N29_03640 [Chloroflexota bacterium]|nr:hypothetical protein [Chloroflexota bacterium]